MENHAVKSVLNGIISVTEEIKYVYIKFINLYIYVKKSQEIMKTVLFYPCAINFILA